MEVYGNLLYALAGKTMPPEEPEAYQLVGKELQHVLGSLDPGFCPAYIMDHHCNILAWNKAAVFVFGDFCQLSNDAERFFVSV